MLASCSRDTARFASARSSFRSASIRRALNLAIPAASSKIVRRSCGDASCCSGCRRQDAGIRRHSDVDRSERFGRRHLEKGRIVIFAGGTGNPYFSTDTAAAEVDRVSVGSTQNLGAELLRSQTGDSFTIITYRTAPEAVIALLRNDIQLLVEYYATVKSGLEDGKLRVRRNSTDFLIEKSQVTDDLNVLAALARNSS